MRKTKRRRENEGKRERRKIGRKGRRLEGKGRRDGGGIKGVAVVTSKQLTLITDKVNVTPII